MDPEGFNDNFVNGGILYKDEQVVNWDGTIDGQGNDGVINFTALIGNYIDESYKPGEWTVTIKGEDLTGTVVYETFTWTLTDPCYPPD